MREVTMTNGRKQRGAWGWTAAACAIVVLLWMFMGRGGEPEKHAPPPAGRSATDVVSPRPHVATRQDDRTQAAASDVPLRRIRLVYPDGTPADGVTFVGVLDAADPERADLPVRSGVGGLIDVPAAQVALLYELRLSAESTGQRLVKNLVFPRDTNELTVQVPRRCGVVVDVRSGDGRPISGATVVVRVSGDSVPIVFQARSDAAGTCTVSTPGGWTRIDVGAIAPGFLPATGSVLTQTDEGVRASVSLPLGLGVTGRVVTSDPAACAGLRVRVATVRRAGGAAGPTSAPDGWLLDALGIGVSVSGRYLDNEHEEVVQVAVETDRDGAFRAALPVLPVDSLVVVIEGEGAAAACRVVAGPHAATGRIVDIGTVAIGAAADVVRLRLVDESSRPIADADIHLLPIGVPQGLASLAAGRTDESGWLEARVVSAGATYRVTATPSSQHADGSRWPWIADAVELHDGAEVALARFDPSAER